METSGWQGIGTLIVTIAFLAVCVWAYSPKRKSGFREAELLPFDEDNMSPSQESRQEHNNP
ncbi:MAG: cbb3-type cytochrome c oxidase subunit 3 [Pseudomonadota bacterium]|nr:cbb3-type cytochrome c oxidase subunit 3 [Pseudomonadota bacterium]